MTVFTEMGNVKMRAAICYDLAEACAELKDLERAQQYLIEGVHIAHRNGLDNLLKEFEALAHKYPGLYLPHWDEREQKILEYVKVHAAITRRECVQLLDVSESTAARVLDEMADKKYLERVGKGRGTKYVSCTQCQP